jgi:hypothetical protein
MKIFELGIEAMARFGVTHRFEITYADLTAAATTQTITLLNNLAIGSKVENVSFRVPTLFDGGSTSDLGLEIGYDLTSGTDDPNGLMESHTIHADGTYVKAGPVPVADVDTGTVDDTYGSAENGVLTSARTKLNTLLRRGPRVFSDTGSLTALFTATGANLSTLTAGEVHIYARVAHQANA